MRVHRPRAPQGLTKERPRVSYLLLPLLASPTRPAGNPNGPIACRCYLQDKEGEAPHQMEFATENAIKAAWLASELQRAAALSIESYGPEILGFLAAFAPTRSAADDIFSCFLEDFWRGFPRFDWRCTLRAWAYTLARHAAMRYSARSERRRRHQVPLSDVPMLVAASDRVRTSTQVYLRTATKSRMRELREQLPEQDQMLLVLRIDRGLSWHEIALIMADDPQSSNPVHLEHSMSALRKRLERTKTKLRKLAVENGLLSSE
jgi:RNA polymerase sigma-70 factor, ECF subfamily